MNKHTPGPWFVDHKSPFLVRAGDDIDGRHIAHIGPANYTPRFDVDEPNAKLIAAAPDLLEALSEIINDGGKFVMTNETHRKARAATARAIGEA